MTLRPGAVDLHTHVLPALDDGPPDLETAVALARAAAADGTGVLLATSHSAEVLQYRLDRGALERRADEVRRALAGQGVEVTLLVGVEIYLESDTVGKLKRGELSTLNGTRYVLAEPPFEMLPLYFDEVLFQLQAAGYVPVVAHPERNVAVQREPHRLYEWVNRGALVQVSAPSVMGQFGRTAQRVARLAIARRWTQVVASDAHDPIRRPPHLREARDFIVKEHGAELARTLVDDFPRAIVENRDVAADEPLPPEEERDGGFLRRLLGRG